MVIISFINVLSVQFFCVSFHLFLISSASVRPSPFLSLIVSRYIGKGNVGQVSWSSILPSVLTDLLFSFQLWDFIFVLHNHLPIKQSSEKHLLEMGNREEMTQTARQMCFLECGCNVPWNACLLGSISAWHPKGRRTWAWVLWLSTAVATYWWPLKYLELH